MSREPARAAVEPLTAASSSLTLAIDCATSHLVLALVDEDGLVIGRFSEDVGREHAARAVNAIAALLGGVPDARGRITRVVAGTGPGSYTGLRVAIATAGGLARALGARLEGASTFAALAASVLEPGQEAVVTLDARRGNVYAAPCHRERTEPGAAPVITVLSAAVKVPSEDAGSVSPGADVLAASEPDAAALAASRQAGPPAAVYL